MYFEVSEDLDMPLLDSSVKLEFQAQTIPGPTQGEMCALKEIVEGPTKKSQTSARQAAKQAQANAGQKICNLKKFSYKRKLLIWKFFWKRSNLNCVFAKKQK